MASSGIHRLPMWGAILQDVVNSSKQGPSNPEPPTPDTKEQKEKWPFSLATNKPPPLILKLNQMVGGPSS